MKALDLFAGTGWGVACKWLGIEEDGVELMPEAVATRTANGMNTIFGDVWDGLLMTKEQFQAKHGKHALYIASPPCQTFSAAGNGAGRAALNEVLEAIALHAYKNPELLKEFGEKHDDRTALVLTPLAYIWRDMPEYVVLEQVPTVQPVWEAYAEVMRGWGYSVETAILNAEQYGVPQTRRRSILVARLAGAVSLPKPTHSRYYPRDPKRLDPGVQKWISMREALGWTGNGTYTQNNKLANQAVRTMDQPAPTVTAGHDSGNRGFLSDGGFQIATPEEAAALQSYPAALRSGRGLTSRPSPTIVGTSGAGGPQPLMKFRERLTSSPDWVGGKERLSAEEAAALQSYPQMLRSNYGTSGDKDSRGERSVDQPAATLTSKANRSKWDGEKGMLSQEAATLQSYEEPFVWKGAKTKQFLQIGNAVPPVLAYAVLSAAINPTSPKASRRRRTLI